MGPVYFCGHAKHVYMNMYIFAILSEMDDTVLGIAEARATLSTIVDRLSNGEVAVVALGSHRKPEAMIVPYSEHRTRTPKAPMLATIRARAALMQRLGALSGIASIAVFGSVARGEERAESDVDLLVDTVPGASLFDLARFGMDMELLLDRPVDVVVRDALDPKRDAAMIAEAIPL